MQPFNPANIVFVFFSLLSATPDGIFWGKIEEALLLLRM
jgi:hypothetical protein